MNEYIPVMVIVLILAFIIVLATKKVKSKNHTTKPPVERPKLDDETQQR
jgi:hypothetical protein